MKASILIIEDDEAIRENLKEILQLEDYEVIESENGRIGIDTLKALAESSSPLPHVILLDLNMPVMPGKEFLNQLRGLESRLASIPVIVMTAVPNALDLGTAGFLRKPIDLEQLLLLLKKLAP
jgi:CheY-like chemotaxis protein